MGGCCLRVLSAGCLMVCAAGALVAAPSVADSPTACARIVSLAPSISAVVEDLGLGDAVVAATRYDERAKAHPNEVKIIGGYLDASLEGIVSSSPSIVMGLSEQQELLDKLSSLGLPILTLEHRILSEIVGSFRSIGSACGVKERGEEATRKLLAALAAIRETVRTASEKKVLVVVSRDYEASVIRDLYVSGDDGYYATVLPTVRARNVISGVTRAFSSVSLEHLITLDPDVILEVLPPHTIARLGKEALLRPWRALSSLRVIREGHIHLLDEPWATIPGPGVVTLAERLRELFHGPHR